MAKIRHRKTKNAISYQSVAMRIAKFGRVAIYTDMKVIGPLQPGLPFVVLTKNGARKAREVRKMGSRSGK